MDNSSAVGLVSTRTTSGIVGSPAGLAATARSRPTSSSRRSVTVISARRTITTRASSSDSRRARMVSPQPVAVGAGGLGERGAQRSGVERVERVQTTPDAPDPPTQVATRALYSPLESPGTTAVNPNATSPVSSRLTMVDLPMPGWP